MSYEQFAKVLWTIIYVLVAVGIASLISWVFVELILLNDKRTRRRKRSKDEVT